MSVRQRLYPETEQLPMLTMHCEHARFVWNLALQQNNWHNRALKHLTPGHADRMRQLTEARRAFGWLSAGATVVQQGALRDFDQALRNWWGGTHRRPTWRKHGVHEGFRIRDLSVRKINRRHGHVLVPKLGYVRFRITRSWSQITASSSARVTCDRSGRWWVSFTSPPQQFTRTATGRKTGIDRGVANTLALPDGTMLQAPTLTVGEQQRFLALQRRLSRQHRTSRRRQVTKLKLAKLHATLADRRTDWVEQTTTSLVRDFDLIAIEKLPTASMTRRPKPKPDPDHAGVFLPNNAVAKAKLNRAILASCWGKIEQRLADKTSHTNGSSVLVGVPAPNTSRQCAACGHIAAENRESQAEFSCQSCGHRAHADTNAAVNILRRATTSDPSGNGLCGRTVRERTRKPATGNGDSCVNHQAA